MRNSRIYQNISFTTGSEIQLNHQAAHHITNVLRLPVNSPLIIFNGQGGEYSAIIIAINKKSVTVRIGDFINIERESPLNLHLAQGISRGNKMDFTIQKAVELGVKTITPIITARCTIKLPPDRWQKKLHHWQTIIINACQQCGRNQLPLLNSPIAIEDWLPQTVNTTKLILHPTANRTLETLTNIQNCILLIGSEGGFTDREIVLTKQQQFIPLQLGPRILRSETAGLAAIAVLQNKFGDG